MDVNGCAVGISTSEPIIGFASSSTPAPATRKHIQIINWVSCGWRNSHIWARIQLVYRLECKCSRNMVWWWEVSKVRWVWGRSWTLLFFSKIQRCSDVTVLKYFSVAQPVWSWQSAQVARERARLALAPAAAAAAVFHPRVMTVEASRSFKTGRRCQTQRAARGPYLMNWRDGTQMDCVKMLRGQVMEVLGYRLTEVFWFFFWFGVS